MSGEAAETAVFQCGPTLIDPRSTERASTPMGS